MVGGLVSQPAVASAAAAAALTAARLGASPAAVADAVATAVHACWRWSMPGMIPSCSPFEALAVNGEVMDHWFAEADTCGNPGATRGQPCDGDLGGVSDAAYGQLRDGDLGSGLGEAHGRPAGGDLGGDTGAAPFRHGDPPLAEGLEGVSGATRGQPLGGSVPRDRGPGGDPGTADVQLGVGDLGGDPGGAPGAVHFRDEGPRSDPGAAHGQPRDGDLRSDLDIVPRQLHLGDIEGCPDTVQSRVGCGPRAAHGQSRAGVLGGSLGAAHGQPRDGDLGGDLDTAHRQLHVQPRAGFLSGGLGAVKCQDGDLGGDSGIAHGKLCAEDLGSDLDTVPQQLHLGDLGSGPDAVRSHVGGDPSVAHGQPRAGDHAGGDPGHAVHFRDGDRGGDPAAARGQPCDEILDGGSGSVPFRDGDLGRAPDSCELADGSLGSGFFGAPRSQSDRRELRIQLSDASTAPSDSAVFEAHADTTTPWDLPRPPESRADDVVSPRLDCASAASQVDAVHCDACPVNFAAIRDNFFAGTIDQSELYSQLHAIGVLRSPTVPCGPAEGRDNSVGQQGKTLPNQRRRRGPGHSRIR